MLQNFQQDANHSLMRNTSFSSVIVDITKIHSFYLLYLIASVEANMLKIPFVSLFLSALVRANNHMLERSRNGFSLSHDSDENLMQVFHFCVAEEPKSRSACVILLPETWFTSSPLRSCSLVLSSHFSACSQK